MQKVKKTWFRLPGHIRKPTILIVGLLFVFASLLTGWLPGPGGIPLFLIGVALLATEFEWASRFRDFILKAISRIGEWYKDNKKVGSVILLTGVLVAISVCLFFYNKVLSVYVLP